MVIEASIDFRNESGTLKLNASEGNILNYNIYGVKEINGGIYRKITLIAVTNNLDLDVSLHSYDDYMISVTDIYELETAPVSTGYLGIGNKKNSNAIVLTENLNKIFTSPSSGWKRYDITNSNAILSDNIYEHINTVLPTYKNTLLHTQGNGDSKISFRFTGTSLRILTSTSISSLDNKITIERFEQDLVFEIINLDDTLHEITISNGDDVAVNLDAIDINEEGNIVFSIGNILSEPEPNWKRIDLTGDNAILSNNIIDNRSASSANYNYTLLYSDVNNKENAEIKFNFEGTDLRIISTLYPTNGENSIILIDGKEYKVNMYSNERLDSVLAFEVLNLENKIHNVIIKNEVDKTIIVDCIDVK